MCCTCGCSRSYSQAAQVPSSQVTCNSPRRPWINCRMLLALVSTIAHHQLATAIQHLDHDRFLVHVHADILDLATHKVASLGERSFAPTESFPQGTVSSFYLICPPSIRAALS